MNNEPQNLSDTARVFLSYAREDDEAFVRKLYADLTRAGFKVWFDRESLLSRGLTFHQEIKDAIRTEMDRVVYVGGPKAALSNYVREEWQFALECDHVVVTPILRLGDFEHVPGELSLLHCEDFRDDTKYPDTLARLITSLRQPNPKLGALFAVPSLPQNFLGRPDLMRRVRDALLVDLQKPQVITSADARVGMQGMGGIGKSVLAAALARNRQVRQAYPDGIVWISCGQRLADEDLLKRQRDLARFLGGDDTFGSLAQGQAALRQTLGAKAVLLVLDDVWRAADAQAFDVLGPRCRMLVTTRDKSILDALHGELVPVSLFTETEALLLLADAVNTKEHPVSVGDLPPEAYEVMRECGCLPLALALCGGMARKRGGDFHSVLERLRRADLEKIADREPINEQHRSIWRAMQVSVEVLPDAEQQRFAELAVFDTDQTVPEAAAATLWAHTGGLDDLDAEELLINFSERSLVQLDQKQGDGGKTVRRFRLHDLLHDYAVRVAGEPRAVHQKLFDAYRKKCPGGWHTGPDDGYYLERFSYHVVGANRAEIIFELARSEEFLEAQSTLTKTPDLPLQTLRIALQAAADQDNGAQTAEFMIAHAVRREAMERANPLAEARDGRLDRAILLTEQSSPDKRLVWLLLMFVDYHLRGFRQEAARICSMLRMVSPVPLIGYGETLVVFALRHVHNYDREAFWHFVGRTLPDYRLGEFALTLFKDGYRELAVSVAERIASNGDRSEALAALAGCSSKAGEADSDRLFERALAATNQIQEDWRRAIALRRFVEQKADASRTQSDIEQAEAVAAGMSEESYLEADDKALALAAIGRRLAEIGVADWRSLFDQAIRVAERIVKDKSAGGLVLAKIVQLHAKTPDAATELEFQYALSVVDRITSSRIRAEALAYLARGVARATPDLAQATFQRALGAAESIQEGESGNTDSKDLVLATIAQQMVEASEEGSTRYVDEALKIVAGLRNRYHADQTIAIAAQKAGLAATGLCERISRAGQIADRLSRDWDRVAVFAKMARCLAAEGSADAEPLFGHALRLALADKSRCGGAVDAFLDAVMGMFEAHIGDPCAVFGEFLMTDYQEDEWQMTQAISHFAQRIVVAGKGDSGKRVETALAIVDRIPSADRRPRELQNLVLRIAAMHGGDPRANLNRAVTLIRWMRQQRHFDPERTSYRIASMLLQGEIDLGGAFANFKSALEIARANAGYHSGEHLVHLAEHLEWRNQKDARRSLDCLLGEAMAMSEESTFDAPYKVRALASIARRMAEAGLSDGLQVFQKAIDLAWRLHLTSSDYDSALEYVVLELAQTGGPESRLNLTRALAVSEHIPAGGHKDEVLAAIARGMATARDPSPDDVRQTLAVVGQISASHKQTETLVAVVDVLATRMTEHIEILREAVVQMAEPSAGISRWSEPMVLALASVVQRMCIGKRLDSDATLAEVVAAAIKIDHLEGRSRTLTELGNRVAAAGGDPEPLFRQALTCAADVLAGNRNSLLSFIATSMAGAPTTDPRQNVREALTVAESIAWPRDQSYAMGQIAVAQVRRGDLDAALATLTKVSCEYGQRFNELGQVIIQLGNRRAFTRLLIPAAYHRDAAIQMCGFLVDLYPESAVEIAGTVLGALPVTMIEPHQTAAECGFGATANAPTTRNRLRRGVVRMLRWLGDK